MNMNQISLILKNEWKLVLPLMLLTFFLGNAFVFGWNYFWWPEATAPILYDGDGFAFLYNLKRLTEDTWYYTSQRANFPWVSEFHDFPQADFGNYLFIKVASWFLGSYIEAANLYISLGFPLAFMAMYIFLRVLNVSQVNSVLAALAYTFLSYHFLRITHIFFTWYFVAPCYIYYYYKLLLDEHILFTEWKTNKLSNVLHFLGLMLLASFGGYYSLFTLFGLVFCFLLLLCFRREFWKSVVGIFVSSLGILVGTFLNVFPTIWYSKTHGPNLEALIRVPLESELYALKIAQLFVPIGYHLQSFIRQFADFYNFNSANINENASATIGLISSLGVLISLLYLMVTLFNLSNKNLSPIVKDKRIIIGALFIVFFVLFASVGGWVALYALLINSTARGWNRISIFIACFGLLTSALVLDYYYAKYSLLAKSKWLKWSLSLVILVFVFVDQVPLNQVYVININHARFDQNEKYYQTIESNLPKGAAVFQLPFQTYPGHPVNGMGAYTSFEPHVHTQSLKWSFGGVKWREGEWFYRYLDDLPLAQQLDVARAMGFTGLLIDKRAYCDAGQWIETNAITYAAKSQGLEPAELKSKIIRNENQGRIFIPFGALDDTKAQKEKANQHLKQIGFVLNQNSIPIPNGKWFEKIDFRREKISSLIRFIDGVSTVEFAPIGRADTLLDPYQPNWRPNSSEELACEVKNRSRKQSKNFVPNGRWTDARLSPYVKITFDRNLPLKFKLDVTASAVGDNANKPTVIRIGQQERSIQFTNEMKVHSLEFEISEPLSKMEIIPAHPTDTSLKSRTIGASDRRLLGLLMQSMKVTEIKQ